MAEFFLKLPGVDGDSKDPKHAGWIDLRSFSMRSTAPIVPKQGGGDSKEIGESRNTATMTRIRNDSSPTLRVAQRFDSVVIAAVGTDVRKTTTLKDATITSLQPRLVSDGTNKLWGEEIAFTFQKFQETSGEAGKPGAVRPAPREGKSFLQVPGISGDSKDAKHAGWIQLRGLDELRADPSKAVEDQVGHERQPELLPASEPEDGTITVSKSADSASEKLRAALLGQTQFPSITIEVVTDSGTQKIKLEDVRVVAIAMSKDDPPTERVTFSYERRVQAQPGQPTAKASAFTAGPQDTRGDDDGAPQVSKSRSGGPVGTGEHVVKEGECISSIAKDTGHFWQTLWDDPTNTELRNVRKDHNILLPGDRVHVPPLREKREVGDAEMRHRFRRKGQPEVFRVRVLRDGEPRGNEPYTLDVDGTLHEGTTDAEGKVVVPIPGNARRAKLRVGRKSDVENYAFTLGAIDPIDEISGVQGRLDNLGFDCGPVDGKWGPHTEKALKDYQGRRQLPVTGEPDQATRTKLVEDYGC